MTMSNSMIPRAKGAHSTSRIPAHPICGQSKAVPDTFTQAKTNTLPAGFTHPQCKSSVPEPTEAELDADIIDVMRTELQDAEDRILELEATVEAHVKTITRLTRKLGARG